MKAVLNVCRCCLSEPCCKDMNNEYFWLGSKEVYSEMLVETFNVTITNQVEKCNLICEECIVKLRHAAVFKQQVLESETRLKDRLKSLHEDLQSNVAVSPKREEIYSDNTSDGNHDDEFIPDDSAAWRNAEELFVIKVEAKEELEEMERRATRHRHKLKRRRAKTQTITTVDISAETKTPQARIDKIHNSRLLILNSDLCLFSIRNFQYGCFYCQDKYLHMTDLRAHCAQTHASQADKQPRVNRLRGLSYRNVDVSDLTCHLCNDACTDLTSLQQHLTARHHLQFKQTGHLLIPYKLTTNDYKCVLCEKQHNKYRMLSIHMHSHYSNYVCETCGMSYVSRTSLRNHVGIMHREKKCSSCAATFVSSYLRTKHMRKVHQLGVNPRRHCLLCNKTFSYSYQLDEHMVLEHGAKKEFTRCRVCGKQFPNKVNLSVHMRSVHLRERNHECSKCEMRFFTKYDLRRHETSHLDLKSFACGYCESKFKTKDSWRRHLKKQHGQ